MHGTLCAIVTMFCNGLHGSCVPHAVSVTCSYRSTKVSAADHFRMKVCVCGLVCHAHAAYCVPAGPSGPATPEDELTAPSAVIMQEVGIGQNVEHQVQPLESSFCEEQYGIALPPWSPVAECVESTAMV